MITKIQINAVASYRSTETLETDKKVNLIYGLNGTGKSTLASYLYNPDLERFGKCVKNTDKDIPVLVYSQEFINDYFYVAESLKGVFSLSQENKKAEQIIANANNEISNENEAKKGLVSASQIINHDIERNRKTAEQETWKISNYSALGAGHPA